MLAGTDIIHTDDQENYLLEVMEGPLPGPGQGMALPTIGRWCLPTRKSARGTTGMVDSIARGWTGVVESIGRVGWRWKTESKGLQRTKQMCERVHWKGESDNDCFGGWESVENIDSR